MDFIKRRFWWCVAIAAIVIIVAFGRDPIEEGKKRRAEKMQGKDPIVYAIEQKNKERRSSIFQYDPHRTGVMRDRIRPTQRQQPKQENSPPPGGGYYPPAPDGSATGPRSGRMPTTTDGRRIAYFGKHVYTFDAAGRKIPMPDGNHGILGGRLILQVRNGENMGIIGGKLINKRS